MANKNTFISNIKAEVRRMLNDVAWSVQNYYATKTQLARELAKKEDAWPVVDHGTADTTLAIRPGVIHRWGAVGALSLTLDPGDEPYPHYWIQFLSPAGSVTELTLPDGILYRGGEAPHYEAGQVVQLSILDGCLVEGGFQ